MRLRYEFMIMEMEKGEYSAVVVGEDANKFHGMLKLNEVSAVIMEQLKEETDFYKIHAVLKEKYPESTDDEIGKALAGFVTILGRSGLLIDEAAGLL